MHGKFILKNPTTSIFFLLHNFFRYYFVFVSSLLSLFLSTQLYSLTQYLPSRRPYIAENFKITLSLFGFSSFVLFSTRSNLQFDRLSLFSKSFEAVILIYFRK